MVAGAASFKLGARESWVDLMADGHRWDFKDRILLRMGNSIRLCDGDECGWYDYSTPGNIHYGYVGRAAGWNTVELHLGATYAQQTDPENVPELNAWHGDQPGDFQAIEMGARMYGICFRNASLACFQAALKQYKAGLARSAPPLIPYYSFYGTSYPLGYFNGG